MALSSDPVQDAGQSVEADTKHANVSDAEFLQPQSGHNENKSSKRKRSVEDRSDRGRARGSGRGGRDAGSAEHKRHKKGDMGRAEYL